tara:strand:- start:1128 stop:1373 length:246 start_codon:yes stop_codon:yes gene_type:complete
MITKSVKPPAQQCTAPPTKKGHRMSSRLNPQDQQRVDKYLESPIHQVPRRPFKVWILLALVAGSVVVLGLLSRMLGQLVVA